MENDLQRRVACHSVTRSGEVGALDRSTRPPSVLGELAWLETKKRREPLLPTKLQTPSRAPARAIGGASSSTYPESSQEMIDAVKTWTVREGPSLGHADKPPKS